MRARNISRTLEVLRGWAYAIVMKVTLTSFLISMQHVYVNSSQFGKRWKQNTKLWCRFILVNLNLSWSRDALNFVISIYIFYHYYYFTFCISHRIRIKVCNKEAWRDDLLSYWNSGSKRKVKLLLSSTRVLDNFALLHVVCYIHFIELAKN